MKERPSIIRTAGCVALLLLILVATNSVAATPALHVSLSQDLVTSNGTRAVYATLDGVPHWRLLPHLWVDKTAKLRWTHGKVASNTLVFHRIIVANNLTFPLMLVSRSLAETVSPHMS